MVQVLAVVVEAKLAFLEVEVEGAWVHAAEVGRAGLGVAPEAHYLQLGPLMWLPRMVLLLISLLA